MRRRRTIRSDAWFASSWIASTVRPSPPTSAQLPVPGAGSRPGRRSRPSRLISKGPSSMRSTSPFTKSPSSAELAVAVPTDGSSAAMGAAAAAAVRVRASRRTDSAIALPVATLRARGPVAPRSRPSRSGRPRGRRGRRGRRHRARSPSRSLATSPRLAAPPPPRPGGCAARGTRRPRPTAESVDRPGLGSAMASSFLGQPEEAGRLRDRLGAVAAHELAGLLIRSRTSYLLLRPARPSAGSHSGDSDRAAARSPAGCSRTSRARAPTGIRRT